MNEKLQLGKINILKIHRQTDNGFYLQSLDEDEVLLPNLYITDAMELDDTIEVFVYTDSEDRMVATTIKPKALKDQFAFVEVIDTAPFGSFVDIGLPKDLLVPKNKQKNPFRVGDKRIIRIIEDEQTNRLIGVEKITQFLDTDTKSLKKNDKVKILIFASTPLGFKVIINDTYEGMIFKNEIFENVFIGDIKDAFIKSIRPDGKVDISLQPIGKANSDDFASSKIMELLEKNNSYLPYTSKSNPDVIQNIFGLSKKNFKKALQTLLGEGKIELQDSGFKLK
jgi:predicted RNA-binding protein (virulence factor B family)